MKLIKKIFLHIGSHKTGTSSIQRFLKVNRKELKENHSICYFDFKSSPFKFHRKDDLNQFLWIELEQFNELKKIEEQSVIISNEDFSWINREESIQALSDKLYKYTNEVEIIIYLRRQDALAISHKQQGAKGGQAGIAYGHEPYALPSSLSSYAKYYLDFYSKIQKWAEVFGESNITIRIFEKGQLHNSDAVEDFANVVGIKNLSKFKISDNVNESLGRVPQLLLHLMRSQPKRFFVNKSRERAFLIEQMRKLSIEKVDKLLPSKSEAMEFYEQFKESNKKLNEWLNINDKPYLFSDDFDFYPEKSNGYELSTDEVISLFHQIIKNSNRTQSKVSSKIFNLIKRVYVKIKFF